MKERVKVTIIIPHYKRLNYTIQAVKSVKNQIGIDQGELQLIVSDEEHNPQTENTLKKIYGDLNYLKNKHESGPGGNRQTGLDLAQGKYILFLDLDDQLYPLFIKDMVSVLETEKQTAGAICRSSSFFEPGFNWKHRLRLYPLMFIRDLALSTSILNHHHLPSSAFYLCQLSHMLFRKSALQKFKFNYDYRRGGEDWDLVVYALKHGPIRVVNQKLLKFRYAPSSSSEEPLTQKLKWDSYQLLASRLPQSIKAGPFYPLFLQYISLSRPKKTIQLE